MLRETFRRHQAFSQQTCPKALLLKRHMYMLHIHPLTCHTSPQNLLLDETLVRARLTVVTQATMTICLSSKYVMT